MSRRTESPASSDGPPGGFQRRRASNGMIFDIAGGGIINVYPTSCSDPCTPTAVQLNGSPVAVANGLPYTVDGTTLRVYGLPD